MTRIAQRIHASARTKALSGRTSTSAALADLPRNTGFSALAAMTRIIRKAHTGFLAPIRRLARTIQHTTTLRAALTRLTRLVTSAAMFRIDEQIDAPPRANLFFCGALTHPLCAALSFCAGHTTAAAMRRICKEIDTSRAARSQALRAHTSPLHTTLCLTAGAVFLATLHRRDRWLTSRHAPPSDEKQKPSARTASLHLTPLPC